MITSTVDGSAHKTADPFTFEQLTYVRDLLNNHPAIVQRGKELQGYTSDKTMGSRSDLEDIVTEFMRLGHGPTLTDTPVTKLNAPKWKVPGPPIKERKHGR